MRIICKGLYRMKMKTHEQYFKEVKQFNPNVEPLEKYIGRDKKIKHKCLVCGNIWDVRPYNILQGNKCPECQKALGKYHVRKTHEEYVKELAEVNPSLECLEEYKGTNTGILHRCLECGNEWVAQPANILYGMTCPLCAAARQGLKRRKTSEDYRAKLRKINPHIIPIQDYTLSKEKILHKCLDCGREFMLDPDHALQGVGCSYCNNQKRIQARYKTHEEYVAECAIASPSVRIIGKYNGARENIFVECRVCGWQWDVFAGNLLKGHVCPKCASMLTSLRCKKTPKEYVNELAVKRPTIKALEAYNGADVPILHYCTECKNEFISRPSNVLNYGCGKCIKPYAGEARIKAFLDDKGIKYFTPYRFSGLKGKRNPLSYDFYLPSYNCLIEFQGAQHEYPVEHFGGEKQFKIQKEHDWKKSEYARQHNIKLIEIWYYDFDNIEEILSKELNIESVETVIEA